MKVPFRITLFALSVFALAGSLAAQSRKSIDPITRPRSVAALKATTSAKSKLQDPPSQTQTPAKPAETGNKSQQPAEVKPQPREDSSSRRLSPNRIRARINEATRLMRVRPLPTALSVPSIDYVTLAALLPETSQIHLMRIPKTAFLTKGATISFTTLQGLPVEIRVLRANGVNTAVTIFDERNRSLVPLVVEFPIERRGVFREMAYYTSAHPGLLSSELTKSGQTYVNSMVELAAKRLKDKGVSIPQNIVEVAKRLCIVEHVDHD